MIKSPIKIFIGPTIFKEDMVRCGWNLDKSLTLGQTRIESADGTKYLIEQFPDGTSTIKEYGIHRIK